MACANKARSEVCKSSPYSGTGGRSTLAQGEGTAPMATHGYPKPAMSTGDAN